MDHHASALYARLLAAWNGRDARAFGALFVDQGHTVGFGGSQADSADAIAAHLADVFGGHPSARYVWKLRGVDALGPDVALLRAVVGMVPPGQQRLNPAATAIQSLVATRPGTAWRVALLQTTPGPVPRPAR
jgi:uncharacterized protein (TIGR02246 family)